MKRNKPLCRALIFFAVLAVAFCGLQGVFRAVVSTSEQITRFYEEKPKSLDAVFIGGSEVYAFWQPLFGWTDHGIAVWTLTASGINVLSVKPLVIEARKRQPDALYIISLSAFKKTSLSVPKESIHRVADYLPLSINKLRLIWEMTERGGFRGFDRLEYFFPVIQFHSRWSSLTAKDLGEESANYKSSQVFDSFLSGVKDISNLYAVSESHGDVPAEVLEVFEDLLDYLDANGVNALFVKAPQGLDAGTQGRMNSLEDILAERGYPCLEVLEHIESTGIDTRTDYYDRMHTNVHGSMKYSKMLGDYLVEHYHFTDKRGLDEWQSWDEAAESYNHQVRQHTLLFEWEHAPRFASDIPELGEPTLDGLNVEITWEGVEGVDGYEIHRKSNEEDDEERYMWKPLTRVDAGATSYRDEDLQYSTTYTYTVVPYRLNDGETVYGSFNAKGVSTKTEREPEGESDSE